MAYVQLVSVSEVLASSSSNIYLNLITKEEKTFTVELTSQGFRVSKTPRIPPR